MTLQDRLFQKCADELMKYQAMNGPQDDVEVEVQRHRFCALYDLIEDAGLMERYEAWRTEGPTYRVVYYTMKGSQSKDFADEAEATAFCNRHIAKHPEYQDRDWSKTTLVPIQPRRER